MTVDLTRLVKPIQWKRNDVIPDRNMSPGFWLDARTFAGRYEIHTFSRVPGVFYLKTPDYGRMAEYPNSELAIAAANADHAARVLAAIDTALIEELVGAGDIMADALRGNYIVPGAATNWSTALAKLTGEKP